MPDGAIKTSPTAVAATDEDEKFRLSTGARQDIVLLVILIAMVGIFSAFNHRFFSLAAAANILGDFSPVMLTAIGESFVIVSRGIDLSVGSVLGLSGVVMAILVKAMNGAGYNSDLVVLVGLLGAVGVGAVCGLANGVLIAYAGLVPFIATLATMGAAAGLSIVITGGAQVAGGPSEVIMLGNKTYLQIATVPVILVLVVTVISGIFLAYARFGRWTYAIGSNSFAAKSSGIDVRTHLVKVYILSGIMAALAGAFVYMRLGSGSPLSGRGGELSAIAATVIGGVSLFGGVGRLSGVALGALITTAVVSGLIMVGIEPNWQQIVVAFLIAFAVGVQGLGAAKGRGA